MSRVPFFFRASSFVNLSVRASNSSGFSPKYFKTTFDSIPTPSNLDNFVRVSIAALPFSGLLSLICIAISAASPGFSKTLKTLSSCSTAAGPISASIFARIPKVFWPVPVVGSNIPIKEVNVFGSMFPAATWAIKVSLASLKASR